ncbi:MAG: polyketide cyclase [Bacteroidota bacterium]
MRNTVICLALAILPGAGKGQTEEPSNKHFWNTVKTTASPEKIWNIWIDVAHWKSWDIGLKDAEMEGSFDLKAKGHIISLEDRKSKFKVTEFTEGQSYTFKTNLPLGALYVRRYLSVEKDTTFFTHEVWFKGITAGLFAKQFGPKFRDLLPEVMENIKNMAEK